MKKQIKAVLLSALAFPGMGHFTLKKPVQGVVLFGISAVCLYFLLTSTLEIAQQLSAKVQRGEIPMNVGEINQIITQRLLGSDDPRINTSLSVYMVCWLAALVDSLRIGWLRDKKA